MAWAVCAGTLDRAKSSANSSHHGIARMRRLIHLSVTAALVALGVGPAWGQSAPAKDEPKTAAEAKKADEEKLKAAERMAAEERLRYAREIQEAHRKLQAELEARAAELMKLQEQRALEERKRALETYKAGEATVRQKTAETPRSSVLQPAPPIPPQPPPPVRWTVAEPVPTADPLAALKPLVRSDDPKVAALAAQLAEALANRAQQPKPAVGVPAVAGRLSLEGVPFKRPEVKTAGEPLKAVVVTDKNVKVPESGSSLRMSADGKTAAVIAADGSVTVFDTASGKELMRFPVQK